MPTFDPDHDRDHPLDDSIEKLETFIDETTHQGQGQPAPELPEMTARDHMLEDIPILDELVDGEDQLDQAPAPEPAAASAPDQGAAAQVTEHQLLDLIDNLEHRLTDVMETLVKSMKEEMIDSISEEVKTQLDSYQQRLESSNQGARPSAPEPDYSHLDGYRPYGK